MDDTDQATEGTADEAESAESMAIEEKIAAFFEARPFFYDQTHKNYKNKQRRDSELAIMV